MAMEKMYLVRDVHTRLISAVGFNPPRREILVGCDDGVVKTFEADTGKAVHTFNEHLGLVTDFHYWSAPKLLFSSSIGGKIVTYGSGGGISDKLTLPEPVYCMTINERKGQFICGVSAGIRVYNLDEEKTDGHYIVNKCIYIAREHTDVVRKLLYFDNRVYSVGYDQKLVIYDSSYSKCMEPTYINDVAHDAGICALTTAVDIEHNTLIVTGSFDKTVKIWSADGKLVHVLDSFLSTVTDVCCIPNNNIIWVAAGFSHASIHDPKSGENVSDFIGTFQVRDDEKYHLKLLKYFPELSIVVGSSSRRHLIVWKYNPAACVTALKLRNAIESLAFTHKLPVLIFSGDSEGGITKWERMQSNHFMYSKEYFALQDARKAKRQRKKDRNRDDELDRRAAAEAKQLANRKNETTSHYAYNKPLLPPLTVHKHPHTTIVKIVYEEELDLIIGACEDSNIYVWGFDEETVKALKTMDLPNNQVELVKKYAVLLQSDSDLLKQTTVSESENVRNRVAGFKCKHMLSEHTSCVTSLAVISKIHGHKATYLVSGGWDRRLVIWNLDTGGFHDTFRHASLEDVDHVEIACDGIITDIAYNPSRNELAYSSSDKMCYIRKFSANGSEMMLLNTLQGHHSDVTAVIWDHVFDRWITSSDDDTIRIWSTEGMNECEQVISTLVPISTVTIDSINGAIIAGAQEKIKVYEPTTYRLVQKNVGHTDVIKSIIHVPETTQYVTCSADGTIRFWNAWVKPQPKRKLLMRGNTVVSSEDGEEETSESTSRRDSKPHGTDDRPGDLMGVIAENRDGEMEVGQEAVSMAT